MSSLFHVALPNSSILFFADKRNLIYVKFCRSCLGQVAGMQTATLHAQW